MTVRTRFAPSPTGLLHIGGVRTALFCWLYARRHGGVFILRVEDTDRERSTPEAVQVILDGMRWLGLDADEGPFYQSQRYPRYREVIRQWLQEGRQRYAPGSVKTETVDGLSIEHPRWRFNLRSSNTEPLVRLNVEARGDAPLMREKRDEILELLDSFV